MFNLMFLVLMFFSFILKTEEFKINRLNCVELAFLKKNYKII